MTERQEWKRDHFHEIYGKSRETVERELSEPEGQGSQLLRELAKIELQAAVGTELVRRVSDRFASYALDSPGNLRLCRTLLNDRLIDEVGADIEDWIREDSDDATAIFDLWELMLDAEDNTRHRKEGQPTVWEAGRKTAVAEIQRLFVELEIRLSSYEIINKIEGHNRLSEEIRERPGYEDYPRG